MIQIDSSLLGSFSADIDNIPKDGKQTIDFKAVLKGMDELPEAGDDVEGIQPFILTAEQLQSLMTEDGKLLPLDEILGQDFPPEFTEKLMQLLQQLPEETVEEIIQPMFALLESQTTGNETMTPQKLLEMMESSPVMNVVKDKPAVIEQLRAALEKLDSFADDLDTLSQEFSFDKSMFDKSSATEFTTAIQKTLQNNTPTDLTPKNLTATAQTSLDAQQSIQTERSSNLQQQNQQYQVSLPIRHENWGNAFNSQLLVMVKNQTHTAQLNIHPADLGPVEIQISMNQDQANIQFISQHGVVREVIEDAMPRLRTMLDEAGVNLGDVQVSSQDAEQQGQWQASDGSTDNPLIADPVLTDEEMTRADQVVPAVAAEVGLVDHYI